jgi:hypothetical protein
VAEKAPWLLLPNVEAITLRCGHTFAPKPEHGIEASGEYACPVCATLDAEANDLYAADGWERR